jgi:diguanylate cyclase (GGDEF)-like protein
VRRRPSESRTLLTLVVFGTLFGVGTSVCSAVEPSDANHPNAHLWPVAAIRTPGAHPARAETETSHIRSLIEQVRFNQRAVSFDQGITVGPGVGDLEIQFAAPAAGASDPFRYRLLGFDTQWKDAGSGREVVYDHLAPGHYEFDFQQTQTGTLRGSIVESIPVTVVAPYWQTAWFRSLCILSLLFLILVLHRLRVGSLLRHARRLEERVNLTKAELTLAARLAGDAQETLKEQALKDGLTGLWNRRAISAMLEREVCRAQRDGFPITLVMIDLDHFKKINDTYGHLAGDEVLREAACRFVDVMRPYDFAGRYGGEEFLVVLPGCSPHNGMQRAEDFRRAIAQRPIPTAFGPLALTCSVGVAAYDDEMPPDELIHRADEALYRAKGLGRNCVCAGNAPLVAERR